ncbi:MAG TPA: hypothetical protein PLV43_10135 [Aequorivita sp.]|nr:hypothetical protein [Aequorivita sp.]
MNYKKDKLFSRKLENSKQVITGLSHKILGRLTTLFEDMKKGRGSQWEKQNGPQKKSK